MQLKSLLLSLAWVAITFLRAGASPPRISSLEFKYQKVTGIGEEKGVCRRDPSDVIRVDDLYYVYYTKVERALVPGENLRLYPSGYVGTIWYASSEDGIKWQEQSEVLGVGAKGAWDSQAVFTPNILRHNNKFWLYYTGVRPTPGRSNDVFENNSQNDLALIGVAVADRPGGPFKRVQDHPVIPTSSSVDAFDSYRVDDSCLLIRDGKVWLYYKGRSAAAGAEGPRRTKMGVAVSPTPAGEFTKVHAGSPVQDSGHEVQIWGQQEEVLSLVSPTGPNGRTLQYAADGIRFKILLRDLQQMPHAPGLFRPELTGEASETLPTWGISMVHGANPYLIRYECFWKMN